MALNTPTIKEVAENIINDIDTKTGQSTPLLAKAVFRVLAYALAGVYITLYKFGVWQYNQRFPQLASDEFLEILGTLVGVNRVLGTPFEGDVQVTTLALGSTLNSGTQLINNSTGIIYITTANVLLDDPTEIVPIRSTTSGEITNLEVGQIIDFVSPLVLVGTTAEVTSVTTLGTDTEDLEAYRQRVLKRYRNTPQGGAPADYEQWSLEVANVISAYPYAGDEPPDVKVFIEVDNKTDGIPTAPQLAAVEDSINFDPITGEATRRPVTAVVEVLPISRTAFDIGVEGLSPDTIDTRDAIEAALTDYFLNAEPFILGLSIIRVDVLTLANATAVAATAASENAAFFTNLTMKVAAVDVPFYVLGEGEEAKLGTLTFT